MSNQTNNLIERSPVVAVMGHVDHGKSTLLDYIRKTNIVDSEAGGITQRLSAYEVIHKTKDGTEKKITFLDTPGHEAFAAIRARGARVADVAILVVSAEDGVKPQTTEAIKMITAAKIPFVVAINKIDREGANVEMTKTSLAESGVYVEGFGGTVSFAAISSKTGQGVSELLDTVLLTAELEELKGDPSVPAEGVVIEANLDKRKGVTATLIVKNGTLKSGSFVVAGSSYSPVRIMENFLGKPIKEASFSSPVRIIGWNELPKVGSEFKVVSSKNEAEKEVAAGKARPPSGGRASAQTAESEEETATLPIIVKANEVGGLEAVLHEIDKIRNDRLKIRIIASGVGDITENDVKLAGARPRTIVLGFATKVDAAARSLAEKTLIEIQTFDIIYKLSEWLDATIKERTPKQSVEEAKGLAKVLKIFSKVRDRQVLGGRVEKNLIHVGDEVKILRRDFEIGRGRVRELQRLKSKASEVPEGQEFGALVEAKIEIAPGDKLESFSVVER